MNLKLSLLIGGVGGASCAVQIHYNVDDTPLCVVLILLECIYGTVSGRLWTSSGYVCIDRFLNSKVLLLGARYTMRSQLHAHVLYICSNTLHPGSIAMAHGSAMILILVECMGGVALLRTIREYVGIVDACLVFGAL